MAKLFRTMRERKDVPQCRPFFDVEKARPPRLSLADGSSPVWSVPEICHAYGWPTHLDGGGVIGILAMSGGYVDADLKAFFDDIQQPMPEITNVVVVEGAGNFPNQPHPDLPFDPDVEIALDIQVTAASYYVATGKPASIRVYWTDTNVTSIAPAVRQATRDGCSVFSISWGAPEAAWQRIYQASGLNLAVFLEAALISATAAGMTVFAAAGDQEAMDGGSTPMVSLPAACPHVVGCGGTTKERGGSEIVWNDDPGTPGSGTGGGYSSLFRPQSWAQNAPVGPGRIVPDVSGNADKSTGYRIFVHGQERPTGGTSAVAPLYAGLFAAFGKRHGFINPILWQNQDCFKDITVGNNEVFHARIGPDACTGLGVPIGHQLARLFMAAPVKSKESEEACAAV